MRARTISAACQREQPQPPQHDEERQAQDRLAYPHLVPPAQVPRLQRERVAGPDEGHDRGGEGDPVGNGQPRVPPGQERSQQDAPGQRGCAGHQHHRPRRRDITAGIAWIVRDVEAQRRGLAHAADHERYPEPRRDRGVFAPHFRSQGPCDDYASQAGRRGRGDVVASGAGHLAPDAAPPQRGGELPQVSPRGIGCDLQGHRSLLTASCA